MSKTIKPFTGFSEGLFHFLNNLSQNNNTDCFNANKQDYINNLVGPAKSFVSEIAPFLSQLNPVIRTEAKFNKTIMRLNKDMRFNRVAPYRNYFLIHFGRFRMDSEFFIYFEKDEIQIGLFINNSNKSKFLFHENIQKFSHEIIASFEEFNLNNKYSLYELNEGPKKLLQKFDAAKHFTQLENTKHILLQKVIPPKKSKVFSSEFILESIKIFSSLYPVYVYSISENPMKEIERFKDEFGGVNF